MWLLPVLLTEDYAPAEITWDKHVVMLLTRDAFVGTNKMMMT